MANVIDEARRLKSQAMDARDQRDFELAIRLIGKAEHSLIAALDELRSKRENADRAGRFETEIANQLVHILGSKGGILRRSENYEESAGAYDAGYDFERSESYGIVNSYNLVQRLVSRVFIDPRSVEDENIIVRRVSVRNELLKAKDEIQRQRSGKRSSDEYATADLALVCILLGTEEWKTALDQFINSKPPPEPYAVKVTLEVIRDLRTTLSNRTSTPGALERRLSQADEELAT